MRCYCKNCGGVFVAGDKKPKQGVGTKCPQCDERMTKTPDYEKLTQYEARTGMPYSDKGLVFSKLYLGDGNYSDWIINIWKDIKDLVTPLSCVVIAFPPILPPDDFVPEE